MASGIRLIHDLRTQGSYFGRPPESENLLAPQYLTQWATCRLLRRSKSYVAAVSYRGPPREGNINGELISLCRVDFGGHCGLSHAWISG
jgi:hypothetical protein